MGHYHGPNSKEVKAAIEEVDTHINDVLNEIEEFEQYDVNVIVVSDHGMSSVDQMHKINITTVLNMDDIREITEGGTQAYIWPVHGREEQVNFKISRFIQYINVMKGLQPKIHDIQQ